MSDSSKNKQTEQNKTIQAVSKETTPKKGAGHLKAWGRQGFKELASLLPAFPDSTKVVEEPGLYGNPTNYDVSKQTGAVEPKPKNVPTEQKSKQTNDKGNAQEVDVKAVSDAQSKMAAVTPAMEVHEITEPEMD